MRRSLIISLLLLTAFILWFTNAQRNNKDAEAVEQSIQEALAKRLKEYKTIRGNVCKKDALDAATAIADSILIVEARLSKDSLIKPDKPDKPEKPEIKTVLDSAPISPFLTNDSIQAPDSLTSEQ